jgi:hypothetical protein
MKTTKEIQKDDLYVAGCYKHTVRAIRQRCATIASGPSDIENHIERAIHISHLPEKEVRSTPFLQA